MRRTVVLWLLALLAFLNVVQAQVVISQVLYDPINTESGGEAVEIRNDGSSVVDISKWIIATESSATDAIIPDKTLLLPGATFLVADSGWSSARDNSAWRNADLEETITLANSDSGVALKDSSGNIIDAVGWGNPAEIKQGLYEGIPALPVPAGKALVRTQDTNNNVDDFTGAEPAFFSGQNIVIIANITGVTTPIFPLSAALDEDDGAEPGVQLKPVAGGTRALHIRAYYNGTKVSANWLGTTTNLVKEDGVWKGELPLNYWNPPGSQSITIFTDSQNTSIPVTVLELKEARLETKTVLLKGSPGGTAEGAIKVSNLGNVPVDVFWRGSDLVFGNKTIPFSNLVIVSKKIMPKETKSIEVRLNVPENVQAGEYRTTLSMNY